MKVSYKNTSNNESYSEKCVEGGGGEFFLTPPPPHPGIRLIAGKPLKQPLQPNQVNEIK